MKQDCVSGPAYSEKYKSDLWTQGRTRERGPRSPTSGKMLSLPSRCGVFSPFLSATKQTARSLVFSGAQKSVAATGKIKDLCVAIVLKWRQNVLELFIIAQLQHIELIFAQLYVALNFVEFSSTCYHVRVLIRYYFRVC